MMIIGTIYIALVFEVTVLQNTMTMFYVLMCVKQLEYNLHKKLLKQD